jgi:hypothetical protein
LIAIQVEKIMSRDLLFLLATPILAILLSAIVVCTIAFDLAHGEYVEETEVCLHDPHFVPQGFIPKQYDSTEYCDTL